MMKSKIALVTGCTSGIGKAFSIIFAQKEYDLILVSRNKDKLKALSIELSQSYNIQTFVIACGLEKPESADFIYKQVEELSLQIDVLVNNAGFNEFGSFLETNREKEHDMMYLHMFFVTDMMKLFLPLMIEKGYGRILNVGSTGSYIPCPYNAVYAATKSYILSVSYGVNAEIKNKRVTITTLCPGPTKTEFAIKAGMEKTLLFKLFVMTPEKVAGIGYKALMKGKASVIAGTYNKLLVFSSHILPNTLVDFLSKVMLGQNKIIKAKKD